MTSTKLDIIYTYTKLRKSFGRQPIVCEVPVHFLDSIEPLRQEQKHYILRNPVHSGAQACVPIKEHYVNTKRIIYKEQGVNHAEGGWPKDVPFTDEELTSRHRRRIERDDNYVDAVLNSYEKFEHCVKQNNAVEMYNVYFDDIPSVKPVEKTSIQVSNVYKDLEQREIASLSWTVEDDPKLVVAYCNKKFPVTRPVNNNLTCSVWNLENPKEPHFDFLPPSPCWQAVCSHGHPAVILGGLQDGRVCIFDIRHQQIPEAISPMHLAHRDPVSSLVFMQSRLNIEFFSGSTDGQCMWWDIRNLSTPTDTLIMSARLPPGAEISMANSEGVSAMSYEKAFPTRFLCGTDTGLVVNVNRKGKSFREMMSAIYFAQNGPVRAVYRSPCSLKVFITCGDFTAHIWSDDIQTSPIITGQRHHFKINDVAWAPQRISSYMTVSADGKFRYWDLLRNTSGPTITLPVSVRPLLKIKPREDGKFIAIGDNKGETHILGVSESLMISDENDKPLMVQVFDREIRREHILENKVKEIRVKLTTKTTEGTTIHEEADNQASLSRAEEVFRKSVAEGLRATHTVPDSAGKGHKMRRH